MHRSKNGHLRLADRPADYDRLGIAPAEVAKFEDGQRIGTEKGRYEWWYFDAHLDDGVRHLLGNGHLKSLPWGILGRRLRLCDGKLTLR